jgi:hypothetical protein
VRTVYFGFNRHLSRATTHFQSDKDYVVIRLCEYIRQFTQKGTVTVCFLLVSVGCSVIYPIARSTKHYTNGLPREAVIRPNSKIPMLGSI